MFSEIILSPSLMVNLNLNVNPEEYVFFFSYYFILFFTKVVMIIWMSSNFTLSVLNLNDMLYISLFSKENTYSL